MSDEAERQRGNNLYKNSPLLPVSISQVSTSQLRETEIMSTNINLFSSYQLGELELPNRIVMAPLTRQRAGEGNVPHQLNAIYYG